MRRSLLITIESLLTACVLLVALVIVFVLALGGVKARSPGKLETKIVTFAKHQLLVGTKTASNPLASTTEKISQGQQVFSNYCFACHGLDGQNTGVPFAESMSPPVPSLASSDVQAYSDGQLHWVISNGLWPSGMPAAKGILTDEEIWSVVLYIRHLPPVGSLGEPNAYAGDGCAELSGKKSAEK